MKQCPHCGASMSDGIELCPACGERLTAEPALPGEEAPADDLFAEASRQEEQRRAAYRAQKRRTEHPAGGGDAAPEPRTDKSASDDPFAEASQQETERRSASRRAAQAEGEISADDVFPEDEADGEAQKQQVPVRKRLLRIAAIAAVGGLLIWCAKGFSKKLDPDADSSRTPTVSTVDPIGVGTGEPVCYFRGSQPYVVLNGAEIELGDQIGYSLNGSSMSVESARQYALTEAQSFFAAHTRMTVKGNRLFYPTPCQTDGQSLEEGGYLLNCIDFGQHGITLEDLTHGEPIFGDYWVTDEGGMAVAYQSRTYLGTKSLSVRYVQGDTFEVSMDVREVWAPKTPNGILYFWTGNESEESGGAINNALYSIDTNSGFNRLSLVQSDVTQLKHHAQTPERVFIVAGDPEKGQDDESFSGFCAMQLKGDSTEFTGLAWDNVLSDEFSFIVYPDGSCYYTSFDSGKKEWMFFDSDTRGVSQLAFEADEWNLTFATDYPMILLCKESADNTFLTDCRLVNRGRLCNITWDAFDFGEQGDAVIKNIRFTDGEPGLEAEIADGDMNITVWSSYIVQGNVPGASQVGADSVTGPDIVLLRQLDTQEFWNGVLSTRDVPATLIAEAGSPGLVSISVFGNRLARNVQLSSIRYDRVHNCLLCIADYADNTALGTLSVIFFHGIGGTRIDLRQRVSQLTVPQKDSAYTFPRDIYYVSEEEDGRTLWTYNLDALTEDKIMVGADYYILGAPAMLDYAGALNTRAAYARQAAE